MSDIFDGVIKDQIADRVRTLEDANDFATAHKFDSDPLVNIGCQVDDGLTCVRSLLTALESFILMVGSSVHVCNGRL